MGITNDADTVCEIPLINLRGPSARFALCTSCKKAGHRFIIRERLQPGNYEQFWPKVTTLMHLKRPDGSSHGSLFEELVPHKVKAWIARRVAFLKDEGILVPEWEDEGQRRGFRLVYPAWLRAWLLPQWEGDNFTEKAALKLLELYGEPEGWQAPEPVVPPPLPAPRDEVSPNDSISVCAPPRINNTGEYTITELEDMLRDGASELSRFNTLMALLQSRWLEDRAPRDKIQADVETVLRQRVKLLLIVQDVERRLDRAQCEEAGIAATWCHTGKLWKRWMGHKM